jgi:hypothetical protein
MSNEHPDLRRVLDAGMQGRSVVVATYVMTGVATIRETQLEREWLDHLAAFQQLVTSRIGSVGRDDIRTTVAGAEVQVVYPWDAWLAALVNARTIQQIASSTPDLPWGVAVGLASGDALEFYGPDRCRQYAGWVVDRSAALARRAKSKQALVDANLGDQAEMNQPPAATDLELRFGGLTRARIAGVGGPISYREYLWSSGDLSAEDGSSQPIRTGFLTTWSKPGRGLIVTDTGERFYVDNRYIAGSVRPAEGMRAFFVPREPRDPRASNPLATATVFVGAKLEGRVASVDLYNNRGYIEVNDGAGFTQQLITARNSDLNALSANTLVSFEVDENAQGAVATQIQVVGAALPSGRPDIATRFLGAVTEHLRRAGKQGAARSVIRAASGNWFMDRISPRVQHEELVALANFAVPLWGARGLHAIKDDDLAEQLSPHLPIEDERDTARLEELLGRIRTELKRRGSSNPAIAVRRERVIDIFTELQLGTRHLARMERATDPIEIDREAALSAQHFGFALSQAFAAGVVTSLPPESRDVLKRLAAAAG